MYFLDLDILTKQLLPPSWRTIQETADATTTERNSGQFNYLKAILKPFKQLLEDFYAFRLETGSKVNLSAQVIAIEHHIEELTGARYGIFISDKEAPNHFLVHVPLEGKTKEKKIRKFLQKIVPAGRKYEIKLK